MRFKSTKSANETVSFRDALLTGQPPDRTLYVPVSFPVFSPEKLQSWSRCTFQELSSQVCKSIVGNEIPEQKLESIIETAFPFSPNLIQLDKRTFVLELFHGPTLAFKDFGARFMANAMSYFIRNNDTSLTILVATSGDTGSAVANAFHKLPGIRVVILYPSGGVSDLQEKQLTTLGSNVQALEVQGTFDDCQRLAKTALADVDLKRQLPLSSANSINVGRLLPQSLYYIFAQVQVQSSVIFSVPSGNFGNLTAGLYAQRMGMPTEMFVGATNINSVVPEYLDSGHYIPRKSVQTLSNAMDVGDPSNFLRMLELYNHDVNVMRYHIWGTSVDDNVTRQVIERVFMEHNYIVDPHSAVGAEGLRRFRGSRSGYSDVPGIFLSTAHPAKFKDIVEETLKTDIEIPDRLARVLDLQKISTLIQPDYKRLREFLLSMKD